jgi:2-oxoglutarate dehydrogenase E2 component (dihydrolipoamide succinyltransferase)
VVAEPLIAKIDTEGRAGAAAPAAAAPAPAPAAAAAPAESASKADVAMPAAAKLMADNGLAAGSVAGTGKDGRVTKGDVLGALASPPAAAPAAAKAPAAAPAAAKPLPVVAAPDPLHSSTGFPHFDDPIADLDHVLAAAGSKDTTR